MQNNPLELEATKCIVEAESSVLWTADDAARQADLEAQADELLKGHADEGIYTQAYLVRKARRHETKLGADGNLVLLEELPTFVVQDMHDSTQKDLMYFGQRSLSDRDNDVWSLNVIGCTQTEIAAALGITQQAVSKRLARARMLVGNAFLACPHYGWFRVYCDEVHRK